MEGARVISKNWIEELKERGREEIEDIENRYVVKTWEFDGENAYIIEEKE